MEYSYTGRGARFLVLRGPCRWTRIHRIGLKENVIAKKEKKSRASDDSEIRFNPRGLHANAVEAAAATTATSKLT